MENSVLEAIEQQMAHFVQGHYVSKNELIHLCGKIPMLIAEVRRLRDALAVAQNGAAQAWRDVEYARRQERERCLRIASEWLGTAMHDGDRGAEAMLEHVIEAIEEER